MRLSETLRLATIDDVPALLPMMEEFFLSSPYSDLTFDHDGALEALHVAIPDHRNFLLAVSVSDDIPVGLLSAYKTKLPYAKESFSAELSWYLSPFHRNKARATEMVDAYLAWAKAVGCSRAQVSKLSNSGPVDVLYRRWGFKETETAYMREL